MITVRPAAARGRADHGWLDSRHTFSFADYRDPQHMGFRALRVINDDRIAPGGGFGRHPHRDMEIVTYVLDGALRHADSLGHGSTIHPGDVQRMTAGSGVFHSEYNASDAEPLRLLQIWLLPRARDLAPGYEQRSFGPEEKRGRLCLVASPDGRDGSVTLEPDADLHATLLAPGETVTLPLRSGRHAWVQVARGRAALNGTALVEGDGAAVGGEAALVLTGAGTAPDDLAEVLVFDLA